MGLRITYPIVADDSCAMEDQTARLVLRLKLLAQMPDQPTTNPIFISGSDLGFRVERQRGDHMTGTLVVRINGEWVVAEPGAGA
jgi:hypothetical protein